MDERVFMSCSLQHSLGTFVHYLRHVMRWLNVLRLHAKDRFCHGVWKCITDVHRILTENDYLVHV